MISNNKNNQRSSNLRNVLSFYFRRKKIIFFLSFSSYGRVIFLIISNMCLKIIIHIILRRYGCNMHHYTHLWDDFEECRVVYIFLDGYTWFEILIKTDHTFQKFVDNLIVVSTTYIENRRDWHWKWNLIH